MTPTKPYVTVCFGSGQHEATEFNDLSYARRHMTLNAPAALYRGSQVRTLVDGVAYLNQFATPIQEVV